MRQRLTKEIINHRLELAGRPERLVGEFTKAINKSLFDCGNGHTWMGTPNDVLNNGSGCPHCYREKTNLTKEIINDRLIESNSPVRLIGDYINKSIKCQVECNHGHKWMAWVGNILSGDGCRKCATEASKLSKEIINQRLIDADRTERLIGVYHGAATRTLFECEKGHTWEAMPYNVVNSGSGCPHCADYTNGGFKPSLPAWEYAFIRDGYLKFGITNDLIRRLNEHRRWGEILLVHEKYHPNGQNALLWENTIKQTYGGRYVTKEQCPDGYTETLPITLLESIKMMVIPI
jgi:hypothetical protein